MEELISGECLDKIKQLRKTLHRYPELSGKESKTAARLKSFLKDSAPDKIIESLGGQGLAAIYESGNDGPCLLFRADLDALPIEEENNVAHKSQHQGVAHLCGHDGHMAVLAGFSVILKKCRPTAGKIVLLFQPEEETGQGAAKVIADEQFKEIKPDFAFAFHNLPGFESGNIIIREGTFAAASKGMIVKLKGRSSHAAQPQLGHSPATMFSELVHGLGKLASAKEKYADFILVTVIHARLGEVAFGTNPGEAVVMATLRTFMDKDMEILTRNAEDLCNTLSKKHTIAVNISYTEEFPATINHEKAANHVRLAAEAAHVKIGEMKEPFRWSEDFGHFTQRYPGALFGIGSGKDHPSLHNSDFDFPDEIIETGIGMYYHLARKIVKLRKNV